MNHRRMFLLAVLLVAALGCVAPSFTSAPTAAPATVMPTSTEDSRLSTLVAEKVFISMTETALAIPPTPTFTATPVPPTFTPTPTATRTVQSEIILQEDSSTLFMDDRAGYLIVIPEGWLLARIGQPEFPDALTAAEALNPLLHQAFLSAQSESPDFMRLFAAYTQEEIAQGEPVTTIKLMLDETRGASFNSDQDLQAIAVDLQKTIPGFEVTSLNIMTSPNDVQFGVLEARMDNGAGVMTYEKRVYFRTEIGLASAWLATGETLKLAIFPAFDAIADTIRMLP